MEIPNDNVTGRPFLLALKVDDIDLVLSHMKEWSYETFKDFRLAAQVSLIKAAHLSLFSSLGYRYACSSAGQFVGHDILGQFFRHNRYLEKPIVLQNALKYFREFRHMVRPIQGNPTELTGTLLDGKIRLCGDSSGYPWGMIIYVKTGEFVNAVLVPAVANENDMVSYYEFLQNDRTAVYFMDGFFDKEKMIWRINSNRTPGVWSKSADSYPTKI